MEAYSSFDLTRTKNNGFKDASLLNVLQFLMIKYRDFVACEAMLLMCFINSSLLSKVIPRSLSFEHLIKRVLLML